MTIVILLLGLVLPYNKDGYLRAQEVKMLQLDMHKVPTVVILGGSNVAFGYDSELLSDLLHKPVINAGLHAGLGLKFILDDCLPRLHKGDILVLSPEYEHFFMNNCDGQGALADMFFIKRMHYPKSLSIGQVRTIVENVPAWMKRKVEYTLFELFHLKTDPVYRLSSFNKYGDVTWHWHNNRPHGNPKGNGILEKVEGFNEEFFQQTIKELRILEQKGVTIVLFPPAIEETAYMLKRQRIDYVSRRFADSGYPFACYADTMDVSMFYDTSYHLNHDGAICHSKILAKVLGELLADK